MKKLGILAVIVLALYGFVNLLPDKEVTPAWGYPTVSGYFRTWPFTSGSYEFLDTIGVAANTTVLCYRANRTIVGAKVRVVCYGEDSLQVVAITTGITGQTAKTSTFISYTGDALPGPYVHEFDYRDLEADSIKVVRSVAVNKGYVLIQGFYKK